MKQQVTLRIDESLLKAIDKATDGVRYRSRAHVVEIAISDFLRAERERNAAKRSTKKN